MDVPAWVWLVTLVGLVGLIIADLAIIGRRPHEPSIRESLLWVVFYIGLAAAFGAGIWLVSGGRHAGEFFAGWLTEYSLSVDNLFVFVIIMARFGVPRQFQQKVLLIGIGLALLMRGAFIAAGAAAVQRFVWIFYVFGAFLLFTAFKLVRHGGDDDETEFRENPMIRWSRRVLPVADTYDCPNLTTVRAGRRVFTPLFIVTIALGTTDLIFAFDSIPAIFGLTKEAYLVFTANVFALMGLRQLYFLLGGLLDRLIYLSAGLAVVLGFIGVKLILEALHDNNLPFVNAGQPLQGIPTVPIWVSLVFIVGVLMITTTASLVSAQRQLRRAERGAPVTRR